MREADRNLAKGVTVADICRKFGIAEATYHRWRKHHDSAQVDDARSVRELEHVAGTAFVDWTLISSGQKDGVQNWDGLLRASALLYAQIDRMNVPLVNGAFRSRRVSMLHLRSAQLANLREVGCRREHLARGPVGTFLVQDNDPMSTAIFIENSGLTVRSGQLTAQLPAGTTLRLAHFGCRLLGCLRKKDRDVPPAVPRGSPLDIAWTAKFGRRWADADDATGKLARGLTQAADLAGASGVVLYDTMRSGSDYWRPGNLLTNAADLTRARLPSISVSYAREDSLCPPPDLLQTFKTSAMSFGQYAREYAEYLRRGTPPPVEVAAAAAVIAQAQGYLTAFYCTDPHIPGYGDPNAMIAGTPYDERHWLDQDEPALREPGCHRVVLAEEVGRLLSRQGVSVEVIEIDQALNRCLRRAFVASVKE